MISDYPLCCPGNDNGNMEIFQQFFVHHLNADLANVFASYPESFHINIQYAKPVGSDIVEPGTSAALIKIYNKIRFPHLLPLGASPGTSGR